MKNKVIAIIVIVLLAVAGAAYLSRPDSNQASIPKSGWYNTEDIVAEIMASGVALNYDYDLDPSEYRIGEVEPTIYDINDTEDNLFIYIFDNMVGRNTSVSSFNETFATSINQTLQSRNAVILQTGDTAAETIFQAVTFNLNDGSTRIYEACSDNWQVVYIMEYYSNEIADESGTVYDDQYTRATYGIKYVGDLNALVDDEIVVVDIDAVNFSVHAPLEASTMKDEDYYIFGGHIEFFLDNLNKQITCKVSWNGNEESMDMLYE